MEDEVKIAVDVQALDPGEESDERWGKLIVDGSATRKELLRSEERVLTDNRVFDNVS